MGTGAVVEGPFRCVLCKFGVWLDDVMGSPTPRGSCLCVHCYYRENESERVMPARLRRELVAVLADAP